MKPFVLAIDQGTTSTRAVLVDQRGAIVSKGQVDLRSFFPFEGAVEQDPMEIYQSVEQAIHLAMAEKKVSWSDIAAIGITNQRETTVVWDRKTGVPVYPAIVWQSRQTLSYCQRSPSELRQIKTRTGLPLNPYFSATKIQYILDRPNVKKRAKKNELCFGTIDSWLLYQLSGGRSHSTDVSNASRTLLFNVKTLRWDPFLLRLFDIPMSMLPEVKDTADDFGYIERDGAIIPITAMVGDQQSALFGQNCFEKGQVKNTYGTGCFMLMNTGSKPVFSKKGLLTTVAWKLGPKTTYALEGSVFIAGASVQWLRDQMEIIRTAPESESFAHQAKEEVYFVPAFVGLGTPHWDNRVRGSIFGITRATTKYDLVRATLQAIAFQTKDVLDVMKEETKIAIPRLWVDGGASANQYLMQFQSDILNTPIYLPDILETTSMGAAYLAGLKVGFFPSQAHIATIKTIRQTYRPGMKRSEVEKRCAKWRLAIRAAQVFKD